MYHPAQELCRRDRYAIDYFIATISVGRRWCGRNPGTLRKLTYKRYRRLEHLTFMSTQVFPKLQFLRDDFIAFGCLS